ncbi:hypothetical protein BN946_scf184829.g17 [Trametes cinnabarina]|uniref:Uncharacterized protein n=1 Tax=Pycnoporus cinnabarinus TaxID=5643 RepID=A0A060SF95_PYCCI|nr:hypothetical protein BN946_scf184829.g17 [Trametes cinnabarina]
MFPDHDSCYASAPSDASADASFLLTDSSYDFFALSDWFSPLSLPSSLDPLTDFSDSFTVAQDITSHGVVPHAHNELRLAYLDECSSDASSLDICSSGYTLDASHVSPCREACKTIPDESSSSVRSEMPACIDPALIFGAAPLQPMPSWSHIDDEDESPTIDEQILAPDCPDRVLVASPSCSPEPEEAPSTPSLTHSSSPSSCSSTPSALRTPSCSPSPSPAADDYEPSPCEDDDEDDDEYIPAHCMRAKRVARAGRSSAPSKRGGKKTVRASPYPAVYLSASSSSSSARDSSSPCPTEFSSDLRRRRRFAPLFPHDL